MKNYKLSVCDREYKEWCICDSDTHEDVTAMSEFEPFNHTLFHGDVFNVVNDNIDLVHSLVRNSAQIPAVLHLSGSIYGKYKNKYIYKCIPDNKHLPIFLVPYENKSIGFNKHKVNKYVTIQFDRWNSKEHPYAIIKNNIGDVEELNHFYEYQLYCKSLNSSIQGFTKDARRSIQKVSSQSTINEIIDKHNITERNDRYIFSIDGGGTQDFDDAFSVFRDQINETIVLSIYITNVAIWVDTLNLWNSFSERISSIYLPDRKRPMLPTILTNVLCSLYQGEQRIALAMDITMKDGDVYNIDYSNVAISVNKNFEYGSCDCDQYILLKACVDKLQEKYNLIKRIDTDKDVVAYLMMFMNYHTSKVFITKKCGIFRALQASELVNIDNVPDDLNKFIKIWNSSSGKYTMEPNESHDMLDVNSYIHITSPMRRLVDLLNIIDIQRACNMYHFSSSANDFYDHWVSRLEYINTSMRSIRKIQMDCNLLHWCNTQSDLSSRKYEGYVFDKVEKADGLFYYIVYIQSIRMASHITVRYDLNNYSKHIFTLHIFDNKESFKRKVRLHLHYEDAQA
jgi:exoribonuclease R